MYNVYTFSHITVHDIYDESTYRSKKTHMKKTMNNDLIECHKLHFNSLYAFS